METVVRHPDRKLGQQQTAEKRADPSTAAGLPDAVLVCWFVKCFPGREGWGQSLLLFSVPGLGGIAASLVLLPNRAHQGSPTNVPTIGPAAGELRMKAFIIPCTFPQTVTNRRLSPAFLNQPFSR